MGLEKNHLAISTSIYYAWALGHSKMPRHHIPKPKHNEIYVLQNSSYAKSHCKKLLMFAGQENLTCDEAFSRARGPLR